MTGKMRNRLDGTYTRMLRAVLGVSLKEHKTNKELYNKLPNITDTLRNRRLRFIGHCWRRKDEVISELLLWEPKHGARKRGRPAATYIDQLRNDTGLSIAELKSTMGNRKEWMKLVNGVRVRTSLKTGFAQIFSCCPKTLSCPKFGGLQAPSSAPARTPMRQPRIIKIFQTEFQELKLTIPWTTVFNMNFTKYLTGQHNMCPVITTGKTRHVPFIKYLPVKSP